jgi:hypothetical protein
MNTSRSLVVALAGITAVVMGCGSSAGGPDGGGGSVGGLGGGGRGGASGGSGGAAGNGGAAGSGGSAAGSGGTTGGGGGGAAGSGGSAGRGGSGGGSGHGGSGGAGRGGSGGAAGTGGAGGNSGAEYFGCIRLAGAGDTAFIIKRDVGRSLCFALSFNNYTNRPVAGLTLPQGWGDGRGTVVVSTTCTGPVTTVTPAEGVMGSVAWSGPAGGPVQTSADVDVVLTFAAGSTLGSESLRADDVPMTGPCP